MMNPQIAIRNAVVKNTINVLILAYNDIIKSNNAQIGKKLLEDVRRNQLVDAIKNNKQKYKYDYIVSTESGEYTSDYRTNGRIDICVYYSPKQYSQEYLSFECKRFVSGNSSLSEVKKAYYDEGIHRYEIDKYHCDTGFGGMIAFCEEGNYTDLKNTIVSVLNNCSLENVEDYSCRYNHKYLHKGIVKNNKNDKINIISIIMNFAA